MKYKVYKIRLNPADAKTGISPPGAEFNQERMEAWTAAVNNTEAAIIASLPGEMRDALPCMMRRLPRERADACCSRCGGSGRRDDRPHWIVIAGEEDCGKICFKCLGHGVETHMLPAFFRRRTVDTLRNQKPEKAMEWASRVIAAVDNPYRPILIDIATLILAGRLQDVFSQPH